MQLFALWLYGTRLSFNHLINFVLSRNICVLLEINLMHFVLFFGIILCLYYWNFITSWNQIGGVRSQLILLFVTVSTMINVETRLYYFLHVLDKRWTGRTYWSCTKMKRKGKPRRQLLWISARK